MIAKTPDLAARLKLPPQVWMGVVQSASEGVVLLDEQQGMLYLNPAGRQMFGLPLARAQRQGTLFSTLLAAGSRTGFRRWFAGLATAAPAALRTVCVGVRRDGTSFSVQCRWQSLPVPASASATPPAVQALFLRDLSNETALEDELQVVQRRLDTLVDLAPIAIWVSEGDQVQYANQAAARLLGEPEGRALQGRSIYKLLHADAHRQLRARMARAMRHEGEMETLQARLLRADGQQREVEIALAALPDHGHTTVQMVVNDVTQRNEEVRELERSRLALKRLSANVVEAREAERKRIARELHDELGQALSALKMEVAECIDVDAQTEQSQRAESVLRMVDDLVRSVRRIAADLRPLMLDDLGLADAVQALAHDFARRQGLQMQLQIRLPASGAAALPGDRVATALYRIVQEALTNVQRHAQAKKVRIELALQGRQLFLSVCDDGIGLMETQWARDGQFGLLGMRERVEALGGRFELGAPVEGGTCVQVWLPVDVAGAALPKPQPEPPKKRPARSAKAGSARPASPTRQAPLARPKPSS